MMSAPWSPLLIAAALGIRLLAVAILLTIVVRAFRAGRRP